MRINKKLALMSMLALAGTTGSIFTYLHQSNPAIVHANDSNDALSHGDYDGWSDQVGKSHFVIINALTNQKIKDEDNVSQTKVDEENKSIFANGRKVYQKYGFKDHMTEAEINKSYQNLYNAYFGSADGIQTYANDLNEIYKDCGPSGYSVVAVKTDDQNPLQFDILVTPKGQESSFKDLTKIYQKDFNHDKKLVKDGNDYRAASLDLIAKYYFDQGSDESSSASSTSSSAASAAASSSAATAIKPSSTATSTSKANNDDTKAVETNLTPTPLPSENSDSNANSADDNSPADSNDDPNDSNSPTDSNNDNDGGNDNQTEPQSATNAQPASNGQSDSQTAASPNNQTLPQTGTKASAGLLILAAIPLLSGLQILTPKDNQK